MSEGSTQTDKISGYKYESASSAHTAAYLMPSVLKCLSEANAKKIFDLGCGNGALANDLTNRGYVVTGVDPSDEGIQIANSTYPELVLRHGSAYDDLAAVYGQFNAVVSLEVVEHVFYPRKYAKCVFDLLEPGGIAIISTPYHGYWKNLILAITGKMDQHFTPLWDYGHIKFWSRSSLSQLLTEAGLEVMKFIRVGRIPALAKSMIAVAKRAK